MRRKDRELNIFSMSALDLFASALGAFILITLILIPYYLKQGPQEEPVPLECPIPEPAPECPVCPPPTPIPECPPPTPAEVRIADNLLIMQMSWSQRADVDMHVKTPDGEYNYQRVSIPGAPGRFTLDNRSGGTAERPALEIWMAYNPTPGTYEICYNLYSTGQARLPVRVGGRLDKPHGPVVLPPTEIRQTDRQYCVLKFSIDSEFNYTQITPR
ncbi:hypothetical protein [Marinobacter mobilis]|uniref:DUF2135 domain-containing protein n=1 Tax=Marinobacter mobilis TaxID=488533 RepID=A0A1H3ATW4_9GAMM|nr:hypothetical protein [Marinobacter mobilis]SDX32831.1 hypothetical protein SAMN04487960_10892 [Marinobacter mobilis]